MLTLVSSRNNYDLLEKFFLKHNQIPYKNIINVDAGSTHINKETGKKLCKKYGINFLETESSALQLVVSETINYCKNKNNSKWLLFLHSDCYLVSNCYDKLLSKLKSSYFDQFGLIGLNTIFWPHTKKIQEVDLNYFYFGLMGKAFMADTNFTVYGPHTIKDKNIQKKWNNLVGVESVMDIGLLINMDLFSKYIIPSNKFPFICAFDEIAMQFLNNNIYNVTLPDIYCVHNPWIKKSFNMPVSSPKALYKKFNNKFYNDNLNFEIEWMSKWKFDRQYKNVLRKPIVRNNIFKQTNTYLNNFLRKKNVSMESDSKMIYHNKLIGKFMDHSADTPPFIFSEYKKI